MAGTLWVDVEDLFEYARGNSRPSGIQRLAFEIYRALQARQAAPCAIRFVRHAASGQGFHAVPWDAIEALFAGLTDTALVPDQLPKAGSGRGRLQRLLKPLPARMRPTAGEAALAGLALVRALQKLVSSAVVARPPGVVAMSSVSGEPALTMQPGDVILVMGAPWGSTGYDALIRRHREAFGTRFALLVYDLIPIRRPEFFDQLLARRFSAWMLPMLPLCDQVFAISKATAADCEALVAAHGITLPRKVSTIPIGTTIMPPPSKEAPARPLPAPGSYVLIVSTIEARKNHQLLFRVWRRLLEDMPEHSVPTLVFAGRIGWLVDDLMRQIANTNNLDGKLVVFESPTDAELSSLYAGCLFTLFPSFYEGWGLPVTESLAAGKPCLTSNTTSMPEAGAGLTRMFDPDNLHDAMRLIREAIEDRAGLASWEALIKKDFRPTAWSQSADALLTELFPPPESWGRPPVALLHIEKTAGTALGLALSARCHISQIFVPLDLGETQRPGAPATPLPDLSDKSFIWGHYDLPGLLRLAPESRVVTLLRDPRARVLSLYYFWRSFRPHRPEALADPRVRLAQQLGLLDFLQSQDPAVHDSIDNAYVRRLASLNTGGILEDKLAIDPEAALALAVKALDNMAFVGIVERMRESLAGLSRVLGITLAETLQEANVGDQNAVTDPTAFRAVPKEPLTPEIQAALRARTHLDQAIYDICYARLMR